MPAENIENLIGGPAASTPPGTDRERLTWRVVRHRIARRICLYRGEVSRFGQKMTVGHHDLRQMPGDVFLYDRMMCDHGVVLEAVCAMSADGARHLALTRIGSEMAKDGSFSPYRMCVLRRPQGRPTTAQKDAIMALWKEDRIERSAAEWACDGRLPEAAPEEAETEAA